MMHHLLFERSIHRELSLLGDLRQAVGEILSCVSNSDEKKNNCLIILTEYITNLIRHSHITDREIKITVVKQTDRIAISIQDSSDIYSPLLELLSQTNESSLEAKEQGMGLQLIANLINEHSYEELDNGCSFTFYFDTERNIKEKILLVDDDPVLLTVLSGYLSEHYKVIACKSVEVAEKELLNLQPDLIISDIEMPECDGFSFRDKLVNAQLDSLPFIYLTGVDNQNNIEFAISQGIDEFLYKPISKEKLLLHVKKTLVRHNQIKLAQRKLDDNEYQEMMSKRLPQSIGDYKLTLRQEVSEQRSGDFVIHQRINNYDYIFLGDVMGHGLKASINSFSYIAYIRTMLQLNKDASLTSFMDYFSDSLITDKIINDQLLTLLVLKICDAGIEILAAGHPAPILIDNNLVCALDVTGPLPGLVIGQKYESIFIKLDSQQQLMLYTDGIADALSYDGNCEKLLSWVSRINDISVDASQFLTYLFQSLPDKELRIHNDDITALILGA